MPKKFDAGSGLKEFNLSEFKKQIKEFLKNKTVLLVHYRESLEDPEAVPFKSWISSYKVVDDTDQYVLDLVFRNHKSISIALPKDRVQLNIINSDGALYIYEVRTDENNILLGIGFTVQK